MIDLCPRPGRVERPSIPNSSKRFTQELTDICDISVCRSISRLDLKTFRFKKYSIQKQWKLPLQKPSFSTKRSVSVNLSILILPITLFLIKLGQTYKFGTIQINYAHLLRFYYFSLFSFFHLNNECFQFIYTLRNLFLMIFDSSKHQCVTTAYRIRLYIHKTKGSCYFC